MRDDSPNPIRAARELRGVTQRQLAEASGLTIGTISLAERGVVTDRTLEAVAKVLGVEVWQLQGDVIAKGESMASNERNFFSAPIRKGAHVDAMMRRLGAGAPSIAEIEQETRDLRKVLADIDTARDVARADSHEARLVKAAAAGNARGDLAAAEKRAQALVDAATKMAQGIRQQLMDSPSTFTSQQLRVEFNTLARRARAACLEACGIALAAASTASESAEAQALTARATAWSDRAAELREQTGVAD